METNEKEDTSNNTDIEIIDTKKYKICKVGKGEDISNFEELTFKVIVVGDPNVGKEYILQSIFEESDIIKNEYKATIGFDIYNYTVHVNEKIITMQIWDTLGLLDFSVGTPKLYKNTSLAIIVYDITNRSSFENLNNWINFVNSNSSSETIFFIVGNKLDLEDMRQVTREEGEKFTKDKKLPFFIEFSTKNKHLIKELLKRGLIELYELHKYFDKINENDDEEDEQRYDFSKRRTEFKLSNKNNERKERFDFSKIKEKFNINKIKEIFEFNKPKENQIIDDTKKKEKQKLDLTKSEITLKLYKYINI